MPPPPYERLYEDIESGLEPTDALIQDPARWPEEHLSSRNVWLSRLSHMRESIRVIHYPTLPKAHIQRAIIPPLAAVTFLAALYMFWLAPRGLADDEFYAPETTYNPIDIASSFFVWPMRPSEGPSLRYVAFHPPLSVQPSPRSSSSAPSSVLEHLFDPENSPPTRSLSSELSRYFQSPKFDIVWTWVNGSDPLHWAAITAAEKEVAERERLKHARDRRQQRSEPIVSLEDEIEQAIRNRQSSSPKLYRDHDELRYSVRSVIEHFGSHVGRFHILSGDFPMPVSPVAEDFGSNDTVPEGFMDSRRLGQVPQWLTNGENSLNQQVIWKDRAVELELHHHAQFFEDYRETNFNSFAIESQMGNLDDVADHFIYMNDDYFMSADLGPADFYTPQYGLVLRMQPDLMVTSRNPSSDDPHGEWRPLHYSNWLLDRRFGERPRPYVVHAPKSISRTLLRELMALTRTVLDEDENGSVISFHDALLRTSHHLFRGEHTNEPNHDDAYAMFILSHYTIERWREMLLWSWVVGRIGGLKDEWHAKERMKAWSELGGYGDEPGKNLKHPLSHVTVGFSQRDSLAEKDIQVVLGDDQLGQTTYVFSSMDGYPYSYLGANGARSWPQFTPDSPWSKSHRLDPHKIVEVPGCTIDLNICFPRELSTAGRAFAHLAFQQPECGDCIIRALVASSGNKGLSAFLPDTTRVSMPLKKSGLRDEIAEPHLPLDGRWLNIDYSLKNILAPWAGSQTSTLSESRENQSTVNIREWVLQALSRYRFVLGDTPFEFVQLYSLSSARTQFFRLSRMKSHVAMICVNDDLASYSRSGQDSNAEAIGHLMHDWMQGMWSRKSTWEMSS